MLLPVCCFYDEHTKTQIFIRIIKDKYVSAEIIDTVIGSFGLVSVAPLTVLCAGLLLAKK